MVDYIESPLGLVVGVGWPGEADPGIRLRGTVMDLPFVYWTSATNNGVVRMDFGIEVSVFAGLDIEIGDIAQCRAGGVLIEETDIEIITESTVGTLTRKNIACRRAYLPRASWSAPAKPDRLEVRKAGDNSLVMFSDLTTPGWYSYNYYELVGSPAPDDNSYSHQFDDTESPYP